MPSRYGYTVAVVCAMSFEMQAVRYMLDRKYPPPNIPPKIRNGSDDTYGFGELSGHNVVLAYLPETRGKASAATVFTKLKRTFPCIQWRFLVGIGGGIPTANHDIRLGDVVVSMPNESYNGLVQYELGEETTDGVVLKDSLSHSPLLLREAIKAMHQSHGNEVDKFLSAMLRKGRHAGNYKRPTTEIDVLFEENYPHASANVSCENCDMSKAIERSPRPSNTPEIHYGLIASGDSVIEDAAERNAILRSCGDILCVETEAAGLATDFPCIVIRGISDYADSHNNDDWQDYAAAAAAAYSKELLSYIEPENSTSSSSDGNGRSIIFNGRGVQNSGTGSVSIGGGMHFGQRRQRQHQ